MNNIITLTIRCEDIPKGHSALRLGIQKEQMVMEDVSTEVSEVTFSASVSVVEVGANTYDFRGDFVFGKRGERFLYLCWGERNGNEWTLQGRTKLSLMSLSASRIQTALRSNLPIEVTLSLTNKKGTPLFATVPPENQYWQ